MFEYLDTDALILKRWASVVQKEDHSGMRATRFVYLGTHPVKARQSLARAFPWNCVSNKDSFEANGPGFTTKIWINPPEEVLSNIEITGFWVDGEDARRQYDGGVQLRSGRYPDNCTMVGKVEFGDLTVYFPNLKAEVSHG